MDIKYLLENTKLQEIEFIDFAGLLFASIESLHDSQNELAAIFSILDIENKSNDTKNIISKYVITPPSLQKSIERLSNINQKSKLSIYLKVFSVLSVSQIDNSKEEILYEIRSQFLISKKEDKRLRKEFIDLKSKASTLAYRIIPVLANPIAAKSLGRFGIDGAALGLVSNLVLFGIPVGWKTRALLVVIGLFLGLWFYNMRTEQIRKEIEKKAQIAIMRLKSTINELNIKLIELEEISDLAWYKEYYDKIKIKIKDLKDAKKFYEKLLEASK